MLKYKIYIYIYIYKVKKIINQNIKKTSQNKKKYVYIKIYL